MQLHAETKKEADELGADSNIKVTCGVLHGDVPQSQREQVFKNFREGSVQVAEPEFLCKSLLQRSCGLRCARM